MRFSAHAGSFIICCIVLLFGTFIYQRVANPSLEFQLNTPQSTANADHDHPPLSPEDAKTLGALMEEMRAKPDDAALSLRIADIFVRNRDWINAAAFLEKTTTLAPGNNTAWHLLGFALSEQKQYEKAAEAFTKAVAIKREPQSLFSLGIIYRYHLHSPDAAKAAFSQIVTMSPVDETLFKRAEKELASLEKK